MEICMLSELFYPYMLGGAERRYFEIARRLAKNHNITVHSLRFFGAKDKEEMEGIKIIRHGIRHPLNRRSMLSLLSYSPALLRTAKNNYDIVDANQGIASYAGLIRYAVKKPVVATFHDIYWRQWKRYFSRPYADIGKFMELTWSRLNYDRIIANSPQTKNKLENLGFPRIIETIESGVDLSGVRRVKAVKEKSVVYVGRLVGYKHVDSLIEAMALVQKEFPDVKLKLIGEGPEKQQLKKLAAARGVNAEFMGFLGEEEKIKEIKSSLTLVNPSSVEGMGLIILEAMACGTPAITMDMGSYFFANNRNSMMLKDRAEIKDSILALLSDRKKRTELSKAGIATAEKYTWEKTARRVEELYEEVCS